MLREDYQLLTNIITIPCIVFPTIVHGECSVADLRIRAEGYSIPQDCRFTHLAQRHDRLIKILKGRGLEQSIGFVGVHNEFDEHQHAF